MTTPGVQDLYINHHLGVQHLPYQNVTKIKRGYIMKDINETLDNGYMTEEYLDAEIIADNDDGHNLARVAHDINNDVGELTDVGASYRVAWLDVLNKEYSYLDTDEMLKVIEILEDNYDEIKHCPHNCDDCIDNPEECVHGCHDCGYFDGGNCVHSGSHHCGSCGEYAACECNEWNDGRY